MLIKQYWVLKADRLIVGDSLICYKPQYLQNHFVHNHTFITIVCLIITLDLNKTWHGHGIDYVTHVCLKTWGHFLFIILLRISSVICANIRWRHCMTVWSIMIDAGLHLIYNTTLTTGWGMFLSAKWVTAKTNSVCTKLRTIEDATKVCAPWGWRLVPILTTLIAIRKSTEVQGYLTWLD